jgi:hypothetical protein
MSVVVVVVVVVSVKDRKQNSEQNMQKAKITSHFLKRAGMTSIFCFEGDYTLYFFTLTPPVLYPLPALAAQTRTTENNKQNITHRLPPPTQQQ